MKTTLKEINGKQLRKPWYISKKWLNLKIQMEHMPSQVFPKEEKLEIIEKTCTFFGCGKTLSMREGMFGSRCIDHPIGMKRFTNPPI